MNDRVLLGRRRRGFVLLAVIAALVSAALLGMTISTTSADELASVQNRLNVTRAAWLAEACVEAARASIGEPLSQEDRAPEVWKALDSVVASSPLTAGCDIAAEPAGTRLDVNSASGPELAVMFRELGFSLARTDSVVDAILDWRDRDDEPRPFGAERDWYEREGLMPPRNDAFRSTDELKLVRGLERLAGLDSLLGVEQERIWLDRAPLPVIATLAGMTNDALAQLDDRRRARLSIGDLAAFTGTLTPEARDSLLAHFPELVSRTTFTPEAWTVTARSTWGVPAMTATQSVRLVRAGGRAAVVRCILEP